VNFQHLLTFLLLAGLAGGQTKTKCAEGNLDCGVQLNPLTTKVDGTSHYSSDFISAPVPLNIKPIKVAAGRLNGKDKALMVVSFTVNIDGTVHDAKIVRSLSPYLDKKALVTVRTWKFKPAMNRDKKPTSLKGVTAEVVFGAS
jgi:TonB family protein